MEELQDVTQNRPVRKIKAEHRSELQAMIKVIQTSPIHIVHRQYLLLRLWGDNPSVFDPLSNAMIAVKYEMTLRDVERIEQEAKMAVKVHLARVDVKDAVAKFNHQFDKNKKGILNQYGKPIKF